MARPERKTVDYFPHYISDGKKMFFIEQKYGNDGYATWFKILESLASTDNHFLNLNNKMDLMFLSAKCRVTDEVLLSILNDLSELGEIDHFLWLNKIVYSTKFIESIQDAYSRRSNKCFDYDSFCKHYSSLCTTITKLMYDKNNNNTQSKVNQIKPKKNKEDKITIEQLENFDFSLFDNDSIIESWCDWIKYKKEQFKDEYKSGQSHQIAINKLAKLSNNNSAIAKLIIENSISNLYKGLFELKNNNNGTTTDNRTEQQKLADAVNNTRLRREDIIENGFF